MIGDVDKKQEERLATQSRNFNYEITMLRDVAKARHDIFEEKVTETKESLDLKVYEFQALMYKEVKKLDDNYNRLHENVDIVAGATTRLVALNKDHYKELKDKSEKDNKVFEKV